MGWAQIQNDYVRVSPTFPCPICGKADGCLVRKTGEHVICYHVQSTKLWKIGFLHRLNSAKASEVRSGMVASPKAVAYAAPKFDQLQEIYRATITPYRTEELAEQLGVSTSSLDAMGIGWSNAHRVYTFPVRDQQRRIVGIQTRDQRGKKRMVRGSAAGVFWPLPSQINADVTDRVRCAVGAFTTNPVFITEGMSDTAAARTMGLNVAGRFNNVSGKEILAALMKACTVFLIADNSGPELRGAMELVVSLRPVTKYTGAVVLPYNVKDLRVALNTYGCINTLNIIWTQVQEQLGDCYG